VNALDVRNLTVCYGGHVVLHRLSLEVPAGSFVSLVGPSGCGKTTLLRAIAGLLASADGEVVLFGRRVHRCSREAGMLFQENALLPWRTARQNVALGLRFRGMPADRAGREADRWLERLGLQAFADHYPHELSGGMKQRVALAQVLAPGPRLLLMDEPFASLDAILRHLVQTDFLSLVRETGVTVLLVTHDLEEALLLSEQVALMSAGPAARIISMHRVPYGYPRDLDAVRALPAFGNLLKEIWTRLQREAGRMGWEMPA